MAYLGEVKLAAGTNNAADVDVLTMPRQTSVAVSSSDSVAASADTDADITYAAAGAGVSHVISGVAWSYSGGTPDSDAGLTILDGATVVFQVSITSGGPGFFVFPQPKKGTANTQLKISLEAGGSGVVGKVNALNHWTE